MIEQLKEVNKVIEWYDNSDIKHLYHLNNALKRLTANLFYLEEERAKCHQEFQKIIYDLTSKKMTVARAENVAHVQVPEMYMLRRVMNAAYRVADSIRTNISYMKSELSNTNTQT